MNAQPQAILTAEHLDMRFGSFAALTDVSLAVQDKCVHSIIGPNGAGKTTLFHCLAGHYRPQTGRISLDGHDVTALALHRRAARGLARSFQVTNLFTRQSARENLRLAAQAQKPGFTFTLWKRAADMAWPCALADAVLERVGLTDQAHVPAGLMSHAGQRRLEVGMALAMGARVLLLDEPTSGMAVDDIPAMRHLIRDIAQNHAVLLIEHNMNMVLDISDRITVLDQGRVIAEGTPQQVRDDPKVRAAYLGGGS